MSETARRVMQNSTLRVGGYALGAGLYFITVILIARYLGPSGFGHFSFIYAFVGIFQVIVDMGVRNILIRDIAIDKPHFAEKLGIARTLLWILSFISMSLIILVSNLLDLSDEVRKSTYLAGLAVIITFYALGYSAVLRAFEEMEWDILGFVLHKLVLIGLIWSITQTDLGLEGVFGVMLVANGCLYLYFWGVVRIRHGRAKIKLDLRSGWALFIESFPLGIAETLRRITWRVDKLLLAILGTPLAVGLFSAAYKFLEAMNPFAVNLTLPLFPVFSRLARESSMRLFKAYEQSLKFLYAMGIPVAIILFVLSDRIIVLFFGEAYHEAAVALRLIAPVVILFLPTSLYGYLFIALGHQRIYMGCVAMSLFTNIILDLLLIPSYSYIGAAVGTLSAEVILFFSGLIMLRQLGSPLADLGLIWRPSLAGLAMGLFCWLVKDKVLTSMVFGILLGLASYTALLVILQTFTREELGLLMDAMRVRLGRVTR